MNALAAAMLRDVASVVRDTRLALGWSQRELARRARVSQPTICRMELARIDKLTFEAAARVLTALGVRATLDARTPFIAKDRRQSDRAHARCVGYVARCLARSGWVVRTEVAIASGSARGWVDILAFRASDGTLLVIEVKTELVDVGALLRHQSWYEREAWAAARSFGWRPRRRVGAVLVLATETSIDRLRYHGDVIGPAFPEGAAHLAELIQTDAPIELQRALALIDPLEPSRRWLLRSPLGGRPAKAKYANYADFVSKIAPRQVA